MTKPQPEQVSILVTIVDGGPSLRACLDAIRAQVGGRQVEVLVPWDASVTGIAGLAEAYPEVRFLALGHLQTARPPHTHAGQHELFDRRRAAGLAAAQGDLIGILEDRGLPDPEWLETLIRLHRASGSPPPAVLGGGVVCGVDRPLNWAVFFCDFGRYQPPFEAGPREYVTDVNCLYTRAALEKTRELWRDRYHETTVNWALSGMGETLYLSPEPIVRQVRRDLRLGPLLRERQDWGRLFAYTRVRETGTGRRLVFAALAPVLPVVLFLRHAILQARKRHLGRFLRVSPWVVLLLISWSLGEFRGYLTGRP